MEMNREHLHFQRILTEFLEFEECWPCPSSCCFNSSQPGPWCLCIACKCLESVQMSHRMRR